MAETKDQVTPEAVKDFLKNNLEPGQAVDLNITPEDLGMGEPEKAPEKQSTDIIPPDPSYAEGDQGVKMITDLLRAPMIKPDDLELTSYEKEVYLKAMMDDMPVVWDIELKGIGAKVRIRSRNNFEQSLVIHAVKKDAEENKIADFTTHTLKVMQYSAMFQLVSFSGKPIPHLEFPEPIDIPTALEQMRAGVKHFEVMSTPKWLAYITALQLFEGKLANASTKILNKDFFQPAG